MTDGQPGSVALARSHQLASPDSEVVGLRPTLRREDGKYSLLCSVLDQSKLACSPGNDSSEDDAEMGEELYKGTMLEEKRTQNTGHSIMECKTALETTGYIAAESVAGEVSFKKLFPIISVCA